MNLIVISMIIMSFNIVVSKWLVDKCRKNTIILINISVILIQRILFINKEIDILFNINQLLIIIFVIFLSDENHRKTSFVIDINCILSIIASFLVFTEDVFYIKIITIIMFFLTGYMFSINSYLNDKTFKNIKNLVIVTYFISISLNLFIGNIKQIEIINYVIDIVAFSVIFINLLENDLIKINKKNINLKSNLQISNIELEKYGEKLAKTKEITLKMRKNINKKEVLFEEISNTNSKSIIVIDDFEHISIKDKNFINIWSKYESQRGSLSLDSFLKNNIKDKEKFYKSFKDCKNYGQKIDIEMEDTLGRYFIVNFSKLSLNKNDMGVMCTIEDITYKKKAEIRIKENDIKYKKIVDNIPYSIVIVDEDDIIYKNNNYIDFSKESIKRRVINSSKNDEIEIITGKNEMILSTQKASFKDKDGNKEVIALKDITEYKEAIKNLKFSKERYKALVDLIPEGIYTQDFESKNLSYVNCSMFEMFATNNANKIDFEELSKDLTVSQVNNDEKIKFKRKSMKNNLGEDIHLEIGCMIIDIDKKLKIVGIIRDITEQVKSEIIELEIERKKAEYKLKSEFFVNISHEFKTPLNVISSSNQLLEILHKEDIKNEPEGIISNTVSTVKKYSNIIMGLIDNIMDFSRLELNLYENNSELYNAVDLIEDLVIEFNNYTNKNDISIIFDTDEEERIINVDANYFERAISILLTLIVKYSYKESIINVDLIKKNKETLLIQIRNEGSYDYTKYINDREKRSLDIGLDIVKEIMKIYDAKMDIKTIAGNSLEIDIEIKLYEENVEYKYREKHQNDNDVYYRCLGM